MTALGDSRSSGRRRSPAARRKRTRLFLVLGGLVFLGAAVVLSLFALRENVNYFFGPTEVADGMVPDGAKFRIGGLVEIGSCHILGDGVTREFTVTDGAASVRVTYEGLLPSLFRDGQGVVALGRLDMQNVFIAEEVLAKHDETYMPTEAVEAMKRAGTWQEGEADGGAMAVTGAGSADACKAL